MSFEDDVGRLEAIAAELDSDGVSLDRALALFAEGVKCLRRASAELTRVEAQVTMLVEQVEGSFTLRPLGPTGGSAGRAAGSGGGGGGGSVGGRGSPADAPGRP